MAEAELWIFLMSNGNGKITATIDFIFLRVEMPEKSFKLGSFPVEPQIRVYQTKLCVALVKTSNPWLKIEELIKSYVPELIHPNFLVMYCLM